MTTILTKIAVALYDGEELASQALQLLKDSEKAKLVKLEQAATLKRDVNNKLQIHETGDSSGGKGAAIGGVIGTAIGLIGGPAAIVTGAAGAAIGGMAAKLADSGFPDSQLREIGQYLKPGTSAMIALVQTLEDLDLDQQLKQSGAKIVQTSVLNMKVLQASPEGEIGFAQSKTGEDQFMNKSAGATAVTIVKDLMNSQNNLEQDSPLEANEDSPPA
jgi:uncharacterized membrane protein